MKLKEKTRPFLFVLAMMTVAFALQAQPVQRMVNVKIAPNSSDWNYKLGQKVTFEVQVTQNNVPVKEAELRYELSYDMMPAHKKETVSLKEGKWSIDAGTMKMAGFLRCIAYAKVNGQEYEARATAGFLPETLTPTVNMPADFVQFWDKAKAENAKIPIDSRLRLLPERTTSKVNVYELSIQNYRQGGRIYGILCVPKAPGKYPALLRVPGAGVRAYSGNIADAEKGIITLEIGVHGIPVTLDPMVYEDLRNGALYSYQTSNWDDADKVPYKRIYLGCLRAVDYIFTMPEFDGKNMGVTGGSQGGALSLVTAALDSRIVASVCYYPALADMTGYLQGRGGGWPHLFRNNTDVPTVLQQKVKTAQYYDAANFARLIKVPVFYSFGYNDMVCPPTSTYATYNVITAPKTLMLVQETEHYTFPEQKSAATDWMLKLLKK